MNRNTTRERIQAAMERRRQREAAIEQAVGLLLQAVPVEDTRQQDLVQLADSGVASIAQAAAQKLSQIDAAQVKTGKEGKGI